MARQLSLGQELQEPLSQCFGLLRLAFPDREDAPSNRFQAFSRLAVTLRSAGQLRRPIGCIRAGYLRISATGFRMLVPEAAVHKDNRPVLWQHNIGITGQVTAMEPETVAGGMQNPANGQLGGSVFCPYRTHDPAACLTLRDAHCAVLAQEPSRLPKSLAAAVCAIVCSSRPSVVRLRRAARSRGEVGACCQHYGRRHIRATIGERIGIAGIDALARLIQGRQLKIDRVGRSYIRTLAEVRCNEMYIAGELVRQGVARTWPRRSPKFNCCETR